MTTHSESAPGAAAADRPLRKDAAENRTRILDAAGRVFANCGIDAGVEEVARVAGVGVGTLYRRFPSKQALIDELVGQHRRELVQIARAAADNPDGTGLEELVRATGELQVGKSGCLPRLWNHSDAEPEAIEEFRTHLADLLAQAQRFGRIRADVTHSDITTLFWALRGVTESSYAVAPHAWRRHLEIAFAGMRPVAGGAFSAQLQEKPLTVAQMRKISK